MWDEFEIGPIADVFRVMSAVTIGHKYSDSSDPVAFSANDIRAERGDWAMGPGFGVKGVR